jgi:hypothetical protein
MNNNVSSHPHNFPEDFPHFEQPPKEKEHVSSTKSRAISSNVTSKKFKDLQQMWEKITNTTKAPLQKEPSKGKDFTGSLKKTKEQDVRKADQMSKTITQHEPETEAKPKAAAKGSPLEFGEDIDNLLSELEKEPTQHVKKIDLKFQEAASKPEAKAEAKHSPLNFGADIDNLLAELEREPTQHVSKTEFKSHEPEAKGSKSPIEFQEMSDLLSEIENIDDSEIGSDYLTFSAEATEEAYHNFEKEVIKLADNIPAAPQGAAVEKKEKELSKEDIQEFEKFRDLLNQLKGNEKNLKIKKQTDGKFDIAKKTLVDKFIDRFFRDGRSLETKRALQHIFRKIDQSIRNGTDQYMTTVNEKGQTKEKVVNLSSFLKDFVNTSYGQNIIGKSSQLSEIVKKTGHSIATTQLRQIRTTLGIKEGESSPSNDISHGLYRKFYLLNENYDLLAMQQFLDTLPKEMVRANMIKAKKEMESQKFVENLNFTGVKLTSNGSKGLKEIYDTEITFNKNISKLNPYFDKLLQANLITQEEHEEMSSWLTDVLHESNNLLINIKTLDNENSPLEFRLKAFHKAFSPTHMKKYYEAYIKAVPKYMAMSNRLSAIKNTPNGLALDAAFASENANIQATTFVAMPFQRSLKYKQFIELLNKELDTSSQPGVRNALKTNYEYNVVFGELLNASTSVLK